MSPSTFFLIVFPMMFFLMKSKADEDYFSELMRKNHCRTSTSCKKDGKFKEISYPFWRIDDNSSTVCGYPGFGIDCSNSHPNFPLLYLSGHAFLVKEINDHSITLVDADVVISNTECPIPRHSLILPEKSPLVYDNTIDLKLTFYFNCTEKPPLHDLTIPIECLKSDKKESYLYLGPTEPYNSDLFPFCEVKVETTVKKTEKHVNEIEWWNGHLGETMNDGFVVNWPELEDCGHCDIPDGWCKQDDKHFGEFLCFCENGTVIHDCPSKGERFKKVRVKIGIGIGGTVLWLVLICTVLFAYCRRKKRYPSGTELGRQGSGNGWGCNAGIYKKSLQKGKEEHRNLDVFMEQYGSLAPVVYTYSDIKKMTSSFKHKLGQGGFGEVYKGMLYDGRIVAVKILNSTNENGEDFINEVVSISRTSHVNVVNLLGFCYRGTKRALVYEFMPNGSLERYIHGNNNTHMGWDKLYEIALGIARGLEYLHKGCNTRIVHFDIKPHNILLDQDFCPKISDFGLAKLCANKESTISMFGARGTIGYIAPEVVSRNFGRVSHKSDVYSYGMMVLEMVGGRKNVNDNVSHSSAIYFPHWAYQRLLLEEDLKLQGVIKEEEEEIAKKMILIGFWCIQTDPSDRPSMNKVIEMLEGSLEKLEMPPKPFLYSSSHSEDISQAISPIVLPLHSSISSCTISMNIA